MADNIPRFNAQDFYTVETSPSVIKEELRTALYNYLGYNPTDSDPRMLEAMALMPYILRTPQPRARFSHTLRARRLTALPTAHAFTATWTGSLPAVQSCG